MQFESMAGRGEEYIRASSRSCKGCSTELGKRLVTPSVALLSFKNELSLSFCASVPLPSVLSEIVDGLDKNLCQSLGEGYATLELTASTCLAQKYIEGPGTT